MTGKPVGASPFITRSSHSRDLSSECLNKAIIRNIGRQMGRFTKSSQLHHKYSFVPHYFLAGCNQNFAKPRNSNGSSKCLIKIKKPTSPRSVTSSRDTLTTMVSDMGWQKVCST